MDKNIDLLDELTDEELSTITGGSFFSSLRQFYVDTTLAYGESFWHSTGSASTTRFHC
ncbi:bacteriocin [Weissella cibaria]|uniref:bacteriocin n=1 Tax=Weissella cibaria TaxID=137591 RepID=UPI00223AA732|nr:bacteriocin [Weissella cibaria]MCT0020010.1 bacteriocin [Weissella cibaria]